MAKLTKAGGAVLRMSVQSIDELRNTSGLRDNSVVLVENYYRGVAGGGGLFYVDQADLASHDDEGSIIVNQSCQRLKRELSGVCKWSDFGILPGMPVASTKAKCEAVWAWGLSKGMKRYETFQTGEMTLTFPLLFQVPADWRHGDVSFIAQGTHKFSYDFLNGATDDVVEILLKLEDLSGKTAIHTKYCFDNIGMGRYPGKAIRYTALRHTTAPNSRITVSGSNNYGYGLFVGGSDNALVTNCKFYNCDGQLLVNSPQGSYDSFGDAIYVAARNVTVQSCYAETTQGGRAGIVYEGTWVDKAGGSVIDCYVKGYDRGIHIEATANRMDGITIVGGRAQDCNTSILVFNGITAEMSSDNSVIVKGFTSRRDAAISGHANAAGFSEGHLMVSGVNAQVITMGCSWQAHTNAITVAGNGRWISKGDRMFVNSGGINLPYTRGSEIDNLYAPTTRSAIAANGNIIFTNSLWGGDINITLGNKSIIDNVEMSKQGGYANCGRISLVGSNSAILRNIIFQTPDTWAVDNTQTHQVPVCPVIENIHINSTASGTATLLRNPENTGAASNRYRRSLDSFISNGSTWTIIT